MSHVCLQCEPSKLYGSSDALRRHRRTHHSGTKPSWQCPQCNKKPFSRQDHLTRHIKEKHTGEHLGECERCLRTFSNRYLKEHKETCKSRSFGQANEPPPKRLQSVKLRWEQSSLGSPSPQAADENAATILQQAPRLNFVRGYVAPVPRRKQVKSWDRHEVVTASTSNTQKQGGASNALEPLKLNYKQKREIDRAIEADDVSLFTKIIGSFGDSRGTLLSVKAAYSYFDHGRSFLHRAARYGCIQVAQMLLKRGFDIDARNNYLETPLQSAAWCLQVNMVKFLVQRSADVNARDRNGKTALFFVILGNYYHYDDRTEIVDILLDAGARIDAVERWNETLLCDAVRNGGTLFARRLLKAGASVNGSSKEGTFTPLMVAICYGCPGIVQMLLEYGADVNRYHYRPGHPNPLDLYECRVLDREAFANPGQIKSRWTALAYACNTPASDGEMKAVSSRLLAAGADPNLGDVVPLETAIIYGYPDVIKILLDAGADPSRVTDRCIETLRGLRPVRWPDYSCLYHMLEQKWALLQQYHPNMFADKEYLERVGDSENEE